MEPTMFNLHDYIAQYLTPEKLSQIIRLVLILVIGFPLVKIITKVVQKLVRDRLSLQSEILVKRFVFYAGILIIVISVLNELGFKLSALLGAAGVLGIAIGFASQTSVSNIISGIFLISEKPFRIGDMIQIGSTIGTVMSVDLLSIKIQTPDNRFVRIPNENMIKTEIITLTKFESRRVNINLSVSYGDDLQKVIRVLRETAAAEPLALKDPAPVVQLDQFADSGITILFGVWCQTQEIWNLRNAMIMRIIDSFKANDITIPYPHVKIEHLTGGINALLDDQDV